MEMWKLTDATGVYVRPAESPHPMWWVDDYKGFHVYLIPRQGSGHDMRDFQRVYQLIQEAKKASK